MSSNIAQWPGDTPIKIQTITNNSCTTSLLKCSSHSGTHIDSPLHHIPGGKKISEIPFSQLIGETQVVEINQNRITPHHLDDINCQKIIFKTSNQITDQFCQSYVYLTLEAAKILVDKNIHSVGTDYLSIEQFRTPDFAVHKLLLENGMIIIESLDTSLLTNGYYQVIALPLCLDIEASPARVIAKRIPS